MLKHLSSNKSHRWGADWKQQLFIAAFALLANVRHSPAAEPKLPVLCQQNQACNDHLQQALRLYQSHDYAHALNSFRAAYDNTADPRLLVNIGRMLHLLERYQEAAAYYKRATNAASGDAQLKQTARQHEIAAYAHLPPPRQPEADIRNTNNVTASPHVGPVQSSSSAYLNNVSIVEVAPSINLAPPASLLSAPLIHDIKPSLSRRWWLWTSIVTVAAGFAISASLIVYAQPPNWPNAPTLVPQR